MEPELETWNMNSPAPQMAVLYVGARRSEALAKVSGEMRLIDCVIENVARHGFAEILVTGAALEETVHCRRAGKSIGATRARMIEHPAGLGSASALRALPLDDRFLTIDATRFIDANYLSLSAAMTKEDLGATFASTALIAALDRRALEMARDDNLNDLLQCLKERGALTQVDGAPVFLAANDLHGHTRGAAFFDRDNTLIVDRGYTHRIEDLVWTPGAIEAIRRCNDASLYAIVVTNQSGIARGYYGEDDMRAFHAHMQSELRRHGAHIDAFYHCPFHETASDTRFAHANHPDRKPNPGMMRRGAIEWPIDLGRSFLIGDSEIDLEAAAAIDIPGVRVAMGELEAAVKASLAAPKHRPQATPTAALKDRAKQAQGWLFERALPLWWRQGFDHETRAFHERLDADGAAMTVPARIRVQARQTVVYALAGRLGWDGPWREAVEAGAAVLLEKAMRSDGGTRHLLATREARDERRDLYDAAFVILGCAFAAESSRRRDELLAAAERLYLWIETQWRRDGGGFAEGEVVAALPRRQNPHMHLFEALLALFEVTQAPEQMERASNLGRLAVGKLFNSYHGALPEFFAEDWGPAPGEKGRIVEPGHQFEWSWLLDRWRKLGGDDPGDIPQRLRSHGEAYGVDHSTGRVFDSVFIEGSVRARTSRMWPHTERLKANLARYELTAEASAAASAAQAFDALMTYCDTPTPGLWRDHFAGDPATETGALASSFYHVMMALYELIRVAERE